MTEMVKFEKVDTSVKPHIFNANSPKTPVFSCRLKTKEGGRSVIVKRMSKKFNYGYDALLCHRAKAILGLNVTGSASIFRVNFLIDKSTCKLFRTDDYHPAFITDDISVIDTVRDLRVTHCPIRREAVFQSNEGRRAMCEIVSFRALMGVTDTNMSNTLVDQKHKVFSVDENFVGRYDASSVLKSRGASKIPENVEGKNKAYKFEWPDWIKDKRNYEKLVELNMELGGHVTIREDNWEFLSNYYLLKTMKG